MWAQILSELEVVTGYILVIIFLELEVHCICYLFKVYNQIVYCTASSLAATLQNCHLFQPLATISVLAVYMDLPVLGLCMYGIIHGVSCHGFFHLTLCF